MVRNKAIHIAAGGRAEGAKEVLGLWLEPNEGAKATALKEVYRATDADAALSARLGRGHPVLRLSRTPPLKAALRDLADAAS